MDKRVPAPDPAAHARDLAAGRRFAFGANWAAFLASVDATRVAEAEASLALMLGAGALAGRRFLDIGCGSGLFSLAARRLGATVHSFDYDPASVACTCELKRRFLPDDPDWTVEEGSALDRAYLERLGSFDIVYSWGVLHHTGEMWRALELAAARVAPGGLLFIALYNDQGRASAVWAAVKRAYCRGSRPTRALLLALGFCRLWGPTLLADLLRGRPLATWRMYGRGGGDKGRGMTPWRDVVDWVGGYPFEVARPDAVFDFLRRRGFALERLRTAGGGHACNEFVFRRGTAPPRAAARQCEPAG